MKRTQDAGRDGMGQQAQPGQQAQRGRRVRPGGRATAVIRPTRPADVPALGDFLAGLSAGTRYLRFFAPVTPRPALLRLLSGGTAEADAVVALRDGAIIGHAMAVDAAGSWPLTTDVGVVVADGWQGRGIGSALMRALLARARARGVTSATMDVLPGNHRALAMIAGHWPSARVAHSRDATTITCQLAPRPAYPASPPRPILPYSLMSSRKLRINGEDSSIGEEKGCYSPLELPRCAELPRSGRTVMQARTARHFRTTSRRPDSAARHSAPPAGALTVPGRHAVHATYLISHISVSRQPPSRIYSVE